MSVTNIEWVEEVPGVGREARDYGPIRQELKANPKRWGRVEEFEDGTKAGSMAQALKAPGFTTASRKIDDGKWAVFAMFDPVKEEEDQAAIEAAKAARAQGGQGSEAESDVQGDEGSVTF